MPRQNVRATILQTAESLVNGDRAQTYGDARHSFQRIADLWTAMGFSHLGGRVMPEDVALALAQLKISRIISSPDHEDSWIDLAGYAALGGEIATSSNKPGGGS